MKKIFVFMITLVMLCFIFVGCDDGQDGSGTQSSQETSSDVKSTVPDINSAIQNGEFGGNFNEIFGSGGLELPFDEFE